jgi:hypothetical protein
LEPLQNAPAMSFDARASLDWFFLRRFNPGFCPAFRA